MRRAGQGKKRDANEGAIVEALRAVGARVQFLSGDGAPDLLVFWRRLWYPLEVKSATGTRTDAQEQTHYPIVRTAEEALRHIGAIR